jgi:hypothetical protein
MSNIITGNPIILDTAAATVIVSTPFNVSGIVWDPGTSAANGDICLIKDKLGVVKYSQTLITGNLVPAPCIFAEPVPFNGLILTTITHGTVYIYLKDNNNLSAT